MTQPPRFRSRSSELCCPPVRYNHTGTTSGDLSMVAVLRMVAVDPFPRFTDLFDHKKARLCLHNPFDPGIFMAGDHNEAVPLANDLLVPGVRNLDRVTARSAIALAMERHCPGNGKLLTARGDPLVHLTEDLLVAGGPFSKVHGRDPLSCFSCPANGSLGSALSAEKPNAVKPRRELSLLFLPGVWS